MASRVYVPSVGWAQTPALLLATIKSEQKEMDFRPIHADDARVAARCEASILAISHTPDFTSGEAEFWPTMRRCLQDTPDFRSGEFQFRP
jgi:hypothetical protein